MSSNVIIQLCSVEKNPTDLLFIYLTVTEVRGEALGVRRLYSQ